MIVIRPGSTVRPSPESREDRLSSLALSIALLATLGKGLRRAADHRTLKAGMP